MRRCHPCFSFCHTCKHSAHECGTTRVRCEVIQGFLPSAPASRRYTASAENRPAASWDSGDWPPVSAPSMASAALIINLLIWLASPREGWARVRFRAVPFSKWSIAPDRQSAGSDRRPARRQVARAVQRCRARIPSLVNMYSGRPPPPSPTMSFSITSTGNG